MWQGGAAQPSCRILTALSRLRASEIHLTLNKSFRFVLLGAFSSQVIPTPVGMDTVGEFSVTTKSGYTSGTSHLHSQHQKNKCMMRGFNQAVKWHLTGVCHIPSTPQTTGILHTVQPHSLLGDIFYIPWRGWKGRDVFQPLLWRK